MEYADSDEVDEVAVEPLDDLTAAMYDLSLSDLPFLKGHISLALHIKNTKVHVIF